MLAQIDPFADHGTPRRVRFQTDDDGWLFDDLLVTFEEGHRLAASIKSNQQFRKTNRGYTADSDLTGRAWSELLGKGSPSFDRQTDQLVLVSPPLGADLVVDLEELLTLAESPDPDALTRRMSAAKVPLKTLFEGFAPPKSEPTTLTPVDLLSVFRVVELDFTSGAPRDRTQALAWCADALVDGDKSGPELFDALYQRVDELRTSGGEFTRATLIAHLRTRFAFQSVASSTAQARLDERTQRNLSLLPTTLAGTQHLPRSGAVTRLLEELAATDFLAATGDSGVGKSALVASAITGHENSELIWISASDLEPNAAAIELERDVRRVVEDQAAALSVVVIDGLDRVFSDGAFESASRILQHVGQSSGWRAVVTAATDSWPRVSDKLANLASTVEWKATEVERLSPAELYEVAQAFPQLARLLGDPTLQPILSNPKRLDLIVRTATPDQTPTEAGLASLFWDRLVLTGSTRHERAQFLERLAERQASQLEVATPRSELGDVSALSTLEDDGLCAVRSGRVAFGHDLYGDWTRVQLLDTNADNLSAYLAERRQSPLWHRAIRLRASAFLSTGDLTAWQAFRSQLPQDDELIDDLFVEAALYAADARAAMEALWPDLIAESGRLLKRLLGRLRLVGTTPNEAMVEQLRRVAPDLESYARLMNRDPMWQLWLPALFVIHAHSEDAVALAPTSTAEVVEMWLERTPADWPMRPQAAQLAMAVATRMYEIKREDNVLIRGDPDEKAYRAFLAAAREMPEEVSDLALRLAARRDPRSRHGEDPDEVHAWPEGPRGDVDDAFRDVCLKTLALQPLMTVRPNVVSEILLALLIDEPQETRFSPYPSLPMGGEMLGLQALHYWASGMWHRGPFANFFRNAPSEALGFTITLANFATTRGSEHDTAEGFDPGTIAIQLADGETRWEGDARVYSWFRGAPSSTPELTSVLMALEHWLYERLDQDESIDDPIERILQSSTSVALGGLLVSVGLRSPQLFEQRLRPLLTVPEFYNWDRQRLIQIETSAGMLTRFLPQDPLPLIEEAERFQSLPHRRRELEQVALHLLLNAEERNGAFFASTRDAWRARASTLDTDDPERTGLERLIAHFDPDNYTAVGEGTEQARWEFTEPAELRARNEPLRQEAETAQLLLTLPMQMRQVIDGELSMPEDQIADLLAFARQHETGNDQALMGPIDEAASRANVRCAAAAVAILRFRDWLRAHPEDEQWCIETLLAHVFAPPQDEHDHYFPGTRWDWHVFCAEALPVLWSEEPHSETYRRAMGFLAMFPNDSAVVAVGFAAARVRAELKGEFLRFQHLELDWALLRGEMRDLRNRLQASSWQESDDPEERAAALELQRTELQRRHEELLSAFVRGTLEASIPNWSATALYPEDGSRASAGPTRRRHQRRIQIDPEYLSHAFAWMPSLDETIDTAERQRVLGFWREGTHYLTERLGGDAEGDAEVDGTPYQSDYWLLRGIGAATAQLTPGECADLWQPILNLGSAGHYWVEHFLRDFFSRGLTEPRPTHFLEVWREILGYARAAPKWRHPGGGYRTIDNWLLVLGLDPLSAASWTAANTDLVAAMADEYGALLPALTDDDRVASALVRFLSQDASQPIRAQALDLMADAAQRTNLWGDRGDRVATPAADLFEQLAREEPSLIRSPSDGFQRLLRLLAARQIPIAVELLNRLGRPN